MSAIETGINGYGNKQAIDSNIQASIDKAQRVVAQIQEQLSIANSPESLTTRSIWIGNYTSPLKEEGNLVL